jgi:hypothetical protein
MITNWQVVDPNTEESCQRKPLKRFWHLTFSGLSRRLSSKGYHHDGTNSFSSNEPQELFHFALLLNLGLRLPQRTYLKTEGRPFTRTWEPVRLPDRYVWSHPHLHACQRCGREFYRVSDDGRYSSDVLR